MSEPIKKIEQTPESYSPKDKPEIIKLAELATDVKINDEIVPLLFKKEIIHLPKSFLVGKKVTYPIAKQGVKEEDGGNPPLNLLWQQCGNDGTFDWIEKQKDHIYLEAHLGFYYNMTDSDTFSYIVGTLMDAETPVPEGFTYHEIPESEFAVCWYRYKDEDDIWSVAHSTVEKLMEEQGYEGTGGCSELYAFADEAYKAETGYNILGYLIAGRKKEEAK